MSFSKRLSDTGAGDMPEVVQTGNVPTRRALNDDLDPKFIGKRRCEAKTCQWGVMHVRCGAPAVTVRPRPSGMGRLNAERWDVCQKHADNLDRLAQRMAEDRPLLQRLRSEP